MTVRLKRIISRLGNLPVKEQNAIADLLLQEISWQQSFSKSQKQLSTLALESVKKKNRK